MSRRICGCMTRRRSGRDCGCRRIGRGISGRGGVCWGMSWHNSRISRSVRRRMRRRYGGISRRIGGSICRHYCGVSWSVRGRMSRRHYSVCWGICWCMRRRHRCICWSVGWGMCGYYSRAGGCAGRCMRCGHGGVRSSVGGSSGWRAHIAVRP
jgi:hypothetical protein